MNSKPHKLTAAGPCLLDVCTAATLLGVSPWTVYHWARVGVVGSVTLGRRRLFELVTLEEFVQRGRKPGQLVPGSRKARAAQAPRQRPADFSEPPEAETNPGS